MVYFMGCVIIYLVRYTHRTCVVLTHRVHIHMVQSNGEKFIPSGSLSKRIALSTFYSHQSWPTSTYPHFFFWGGEPRYPQVFSVILDGYPGIHPSSIRVPVYPGGVRCKRRVSWRFCPENCPQGASIRRDQLSFKGFPR